MQHVRFGVVHLGVKTVFWRGTGNRKSWMSARLVPLLQHSMTTWILHCGVIQLKFISHRLRLGHLLTAVASRRLCVLASVFFRCCTMICDLHDPVKGTRMCICSGHIFTRRTRDWNPAHAKVSECMWLELLHRIHLKHWVTVLVLEGWSFLSCYNSLYRVHDTLYLRIGPKLYNPHCFCCVL